MGRVRKPEAAIVGGTIHHSYLTQVMTPLSGTSTSIFRRQANVGGDCELARLTWVEEQHQHQVQPLHLHRRLRLRQDTLLRRRGLAQRRILGQLRHDCSSADIEKLQELPATSGYKDYNSGN
jgi:hypothetical protein